MQRPGARPEGFPLIAEVVGDERDPLQPRLRRRHAIKRIAMGDASRPAWIACLTEMGRGSNPARWMAPRRSLHHSRPASCCGQVQDKKALLWVSEKPLHALAIGHEQVRDDVRSSVADAEPDHLGWMAPEKAELAKVIVLGDEGGVVARSILPHLEINVPFEPNDLDVFALWVRGFEAMDEATTKVLVEQQTHSLGEPASLRSRAAANARTARMSSRAREGKVRKDLVLCHTTSQVLEDIVDRDARTADAGFATANSGGDRDSFLPTHAVRLDGSGHDGKPSPLSNRADRCSLTAVGPPIS